MAPTTKGNGISILKFRLQRGSKPAACQVGPTAEIMKERKAAMRLTYQLQLSDFLELNGAAWQQLLVILKAMFPAC